MLPAAAMLGDHPVAFIKIICGDIGGVGRDTVVGIIDVGLQLAAAEFPQTAGRYEKRAVEQRAVTSERRHSGQSDAYIPAQIRSTAFGKKSVFDADRSRPVLLVLNEVTF